MNFFRILLLSSMIIFLTACGGGGTSNSSEPFVKFLDLNFYPLEYTIQTSLTYDETGDRLTKVSEGDVVFFNGYFGSGTVTHTIESWLKEYTYTYDFIKNEANETCMNCQNPYDSNSTIYTFNEDGIILKSRTNINTKEYFYDEDGDIETVSYAYEYIDYNETGVYTYNKDKQVIEDSWETIPNENNDSLLGAFNPINGVRIYTYHDNGRVDTMEASSFNPDGSYLAYAIYIFDQEGNLISSTP